MTKKGYTGINNIARNITKGYVGIDNVAHRITKGYIGIDNIARLIFSAYTVEWSTNINNFGSNITVSGNSPTVTCFVTVDRSVSGSSDNTCYIDYLFKAPLVLPVGSTISIRKTTDNVPSGNEIIHSVFLNDSLISQTALNSYDSTVVYTVPSVINVTKLNIQVKVTVPGAMHRSSSSFITITPSGKSAFLLNNANGI